MKIFIISLRRFFDNLLVVKRRLELQVVDQQLGSSRDKGDYYQVKGTILLLRRENCLYKACPKDGCNKKVVDNDNGTYTCEKCGKCYENFRFRFLCNVSIVLCIVCKNNVFHFQTLVISNTSEKISEITGVLINTQ